MHCHRSGPRAHLDISDVDAMITRFSQFQTYSPHLLSPWCDDADLALAVPIGFAIHKAPYGLDHL
jgi:hypothetical protein